MAVEWVKMDEIMFNTNATYVVSKFFLLGLQYISNVLHPFPIMRECIQLVSLF